MFTKIKKILCNAFVKLLENALSKKFLVFITATFMLVHGFLPPEHWAAIALAVLGVVSAIDFKHGKTSLAAPSATKPTSPEVEGPPPGQGIP